METAIGTWGTPLQRVFQEQSCTVLGDADGTGRLRACSANDFYAALELWNPSEGVPLCPLPGQLSGLRRAGGRWLWDLLEDQRLTANACIFLRKKTETKEKINKGNKESDAGRDELNSPRCQAPAGSVKRMQT
jgi:hypothetical protein